MKRFCVLVLVISIVLPILACVGGEDSSIFEDHSSDISDISDIDNIQITLPTDDLTISEGRTYKIEADIINMSAEDEVIYISSKEQVASVDENGLITAKKVGESVISVKVRDVIAKIYLKVAAGAEKISLNLETAVLPVGGEVELIAKAEPSDLYDDEVFFESEDEALAVVDENGKVVAIAVGEVNIKAYAANGTSANYLVVIRPKAVEIKLDKIELELKVGNKASLSAEILPEDAFEEVVSFKSEDEKIAIVDEDGIITAKAIGETKIIVSAGDASAECIIKVMEDAVVVGVEKVSLNKGDTSLNVGENFVISATISPSNASDKRIKFDSSDKSVASVDSNGKIVAHKKGVATITASANNGKKASIKITVNEVIQTETPKIYTYVYTESNVAVIIGTCEIDADVKIKYDGGVISTKSDYGAFRVRINSSKSSIPLEITAQSKGKTESQILNYTVSKVSPITSRGSHYWRLIPGNDNQIHMRDYEYLDDYQRKNVYSSSTLQTIKNRINRRVADVKSGNPNAEVIYMIVPSPATIYPETMPDYYTVDNRKSRIEQAYEVIAESDAVLIDLKSAFEKHKNDELKLYWKTDTHWTDYGGFVAYTELFNYIKTKYPNLAPRPKSDFDFVEDFYEMGDFAENLGLRTSPLQIIPPKEYNALRVPKFEMPKSISSLKRFVSDSRLTYTPGIMDQQQIVRTNRSELPSALILRDSYSAQMFDIIAERFDTTVFKAMWSYQINPNEVRNFDVDFVIIIVVERNLGNIFS